MGDVVNYVAICNQPAMEEYPPSSRFITLKSFLWAEKVLVLRNSLMDSSKKTFHGIKLKWIR